MDDKRLIVFVILSMVILMGWQYIFVPQKPPKPAEDKKISRQQTPDKTVTKPDPKKAPEKSLPEVKPDSDVVPVTEDEAEVKVIAAEDIPVSTDMYFAVVNTLTGGLRSFALNKYKQTTEKDSLPMQLVSPGLKESELPLTVEVDFWKNPFVFNKGFALSTSESGLHGGDSRHSSKLSMAAIGRGVKLTRTYYFRKSEYMIDMDINLQNLTTRDLEGDVAVTWATNTSEGEHVSRFQEFEPLVYTPGGIKRSSVKKVTKEGLIEHPNVKWAGFADTYFARLIIPDRTSGVVERETIEDGVLWQKISTQPVELKAGAQETLKYRLYLGPKQYDLLKSYEGDELDNVVKFGTLAIIVKPLLWLMKALHNIFPNWGVAIILLTIVVRLLFFPLTQKQYTSMKALQVLQPKMKEIREKYASDKERMNQEMMNLYKTHKVNPLGGCLPMVIQLPVFFALYKVLYIAIELRHAPFILWINDLSAPETLFMIPIFGGVHFGIMPFFMGGTMYLQQKMTPTTADPAQAKMFMLMPVVFTALSFGFPSGLVLYWTLSNILGVLQQWLLTRKKN